MPSISQDMNDRALSQAGACLSESTLKAADRRDSEQLHQLLARDPAAADLRLSLFVAAARTFKYESLLRPIPVEFETADGQVDIEHILQLVRRLPALPAKPGEIEVGSMTRLLLSALTSGGCRLSSVGRDELLADIGSLAAAVDVDGAARAAHYFRLEDSDGRQRAWRRAADGRRTFHAFHGSRFENFHSILSLGLHQHLNKKSLFGKGIYLSTEQSLSQMYSCYGEGWSESRLGQRLAVLAVCEVVDHPDVGSVKKGPSSAAMQAVPDKYIVVPNNELVRVRYLLVYSQQARSTASSSLNGRQRGAFWPRHRMLILLTFYAAMLLAIGLANKGYLKF